MNAAEDSRERAVAWAMLFGVPASMGVIALFVSLGLAPGLDAGHPEEYLLATCLAWALISLVIPILRLTRLVSLPPILVFVIYANIYFYVLCLCCGLYLNVSWCGDLGHVISSIIVTCIVFVAFCLVEVHSPEHVTFGSRGGMAAMTFLVALSFGGVWEMIEGFTDTVSGNAYMVYGATDTMGDLTADLLGVCIVTLFAYTYLGKHNASDIASDIRIGRSAFEIDDSDL